MTESQPLRGIQLLDYWRIILRRKWIIMVFGALVLLTTAIGTRQQKKQYQASTTVHIEMVAPRVVDFEEPRPDAIPRLSDYQAFYNTQYQIINSRTVKLQTIKKLQGKGYTDWDQERDPISVFGGNMEVSTIKDTRLIRIAYTHRDPQKAAEIANTIASVYIEENLNRKVKSMETADEWLRQRAQEWLVKMKESDTKLLDYKKKNDLLSMEQKESIYQKNLSEVYESYNSAREERVAAESEYRTLLNLYNKKEYDPLISYFATDTIRTLKEQYNDADRQYLALSERYLPKFPQMVQLDSERKTLERKLQEELSRLVKGKEAEFALRKNKEESLLAELNRAKQEAAELETRVVEARSLVNESERNERFFKALDKRQTEVDLVGLLLLQNSNIEVIDQAIPPVDHIRPNFTMNMLLALLVSLSGGIALAFGVEYLDKTFKSPDEVEQYLGVPLLGIFPAIAPDSKEPHHDTYVYYNPKSSVAECVRSIRTNIMLGASGRQIRSLMVTSASPREGKSTLVVSIGITMALANNRTLLVDTDLRRPRLHHVFKMGLEAGLTSLINQTADYDQVIFPTEVPNLFILPAGPIPPNPSEVLGSPRMAQIIKDLENQFDMIIFDSPPCIAVTDAVVLSTKTDGVIFVVKQNATTKEAAIEAKRRLGEIGENLIGCIMNSIDIERDTYGYRYYYYYHYYGEETKAS